MLPQNATLRNDISTAQKAYFAAEMKRTEGHVRTAMQRALEAARRAKMKAAA